MLNSSNNNPGGGNLGGLKAKLGAQAPVPEEEPIIQEVYEDEPDDYNYTPKLREVSDEELRNFSAIREDVGGDKRVYLVCAAFLVATVIGIVVGMFVAGISTDRAEVQRKSSMAEQIQKKFKTTYEGFEGLRRDFKNVEGNFSEANFASYVEGYTRHAFLLDMAGDISAEAVLLAGDERANPLAGLRRYSAKSMLLLQLLSVHRNETKADAKEILAIQDGESGTDDVTLAMQINPTFAYYLATTAPRGMYANGIQNVYTYDSVIEDDNELAEAFAADDIKDRVRERRRYTPASTAEKNRLGGKELPARLIYNVAVRGGERLHKMFADEIILADRKLVFGDSANALERYKRRHEQIRTLMNEMAEISSTINDDLEKFIVKK